MGAFKVVDCRFLRGDQPVAYSDANAIHEVVAVGFDNHLHVRQCSANRELRQFRLAARVKVRLGVLNQAQRARFSQQRENYGATYTTDRIRRLSPENAAMQRLPVDQTRIRR